MEAKTELEFKELLALDERLLTLINVADAYKDNAKALKLVTKLVATEAKALRTCKAPVPEKDLQTVTWRYDDFIEILKNLKTKDARTFDKASTDLGTLAEKTTAEAKEITDKLNGTVTMTEVLEGGAVKLADKVAGGAQKLGAAVNEQVDKLKKFFAGDNSEK